MLKCVIVDDENRSINTLKSIIQNYLNEKLTISGVADNAASGFEVIKATQPDIVFLDIEMPRYTGFDMLEMFDEINFQVIFTTGFDQYALAAIKFSALDYLLKPINITEVIQAVEKASQRINQVENARMIKSVVETVKSTQQEARIPLSFNNEIIMVKINEIVFCKASQDYTYVFLTDGKKILVSKNIKHFEQLFSNNLFFRTHHSFLVNKSYIKKFIKGDGGVIQTEFNQEIPVSRRKRADFLEWIKD